MKDVDEKAINNTENYIGASVYDKRVYKLKNKNGIYKAITLRKLYKLVYKVNFCIDKIENLENEEWKAIEGTEQLYYVSNKGRIKSKIGSVIDEKTKNEILNVYFANVTGKKRYNSVWTKVIDMIFKLVKEGEHGNAA